MAKSIKLNNTYWDSKSIAYGHTDLETELNAIWAKNNTQDTKISKLETYCDDLIKIVDIATPEFSASIGGRYRGNVTYTKPSGYTPIAIIPNYTTYGDRNFVDFNWYYSGNSIYYEIYVQYVSHSGDKVRSNFRVIFIKDNI